MFVSFRPASRCGNTRIWSWVCTRKAAISKEDGWLRAEDADNSEEADNDDGSDGNGVTHDDVATAMATAMQITVINNFAIIILMIMMPTPKTKTAMIMMMVSVVILPTTRMRIMVMMKEKKKKKDFG